MSSDTIPFPIFAGARVYRTSQVGGNIFLNLLPAIGRFLLPVVASGISSFVSSFANRVAQGGPVRESAKEAIRHAGQGSKQTIRESFESGRAPQMAPTVVPGPPGYYSYPTQQTPGLNRPVTTMPARPHTRQLVRAKSES